MLHPDLDFAFCLSQVSQRAQGSHSVEGILQEFTQRDPRVITVQLAPAEGRDHLRHILDLWRDVRRLPVAHRHLPRKRLRSFGTQYAGRGEARPSLIPHQRMRLSQLAVDHAGGAVRQPPRFALGM
ncbi:MAG: hypothetical protein ACREXS_12705 [Gammaproteobacteria bacterium]